MACGTLRDHRPEGLASFVRAGWLEEDAVTAMLAWPRSGLGAHVGPSIAGTDHDGLVRVARYGARGLVAQGRLPTRVRSGRIPVERASPKA